MPSVSRHFPRIPHLRPCAAWIAVVLLSLPAMAQDSPPPDKSEWIIEDGFSLVETPGEFHAPVAMAFPKKSNQGKPGDIAYLVTELRGRIVAITNGGEKILVQEVDEIAQPDGDDLPYPDGEVGLNGMCLSPDEKYLFTTAVIKSGFTLHNSVSRWEPVTPGDWSKIKRTAYLKDLFLGDKTAKAHNIGHCHAPADNVLIFGTGDGSSPKTTQMRDSTNGKLYRMDFNFQGLPDNPFFDPAKPADLTSLYYASGLRNPWAIAVHDNEIFVCDNGLKIDRLLRIEKGRNYPWTGSDISMTYENLLTIAPSIGPSGMVFIPWDHPIASLRGHLLVVGSHIQQVIAIPLTPGLEIAGDWKILVSPSDPEKRTSLAGIFLDGDDIYLTHIRVRQRPDQGIIPSTILRLVPSDEVRAPTLLTGEALLHAKNCRACHVFAGRGGVQGPNLDDLVPRLRQQLDDPKYLAELAKLQDYKAEADHEKWVSLRAGLINRKGSVEERMARWIAAKIEHPQFSSPNNVMPALGLTSDEIGEMTRYLLVTEKGIGDGMPWHKRLSRRMSAKPAPVAIVLLLLGVGIGFLIGRRVRKARNKSAGAPG
jgi:glucose/arabinose dehydrogenase